MLFIVAVLVVWFKVFYCLVVWLCFNSVDIMILFVCCGLLWWFAVDVTCGFCCVSIAIAFFTWDLVEWLICLLISSGLVV